mgnify:CR=1 FL=1
MEEVKTLSAGGQSHTGIVYARVMYKGDSMRAASGPQEPAVELDGTQNVV